MKTERKLFYTKLLDKHKIQNPKTSDGVSRLGLGLETRLETRFLTSRSRRSQVSSRSRSRTISVSVSSSSSRDFA